MRVIDAHAKSLNAVAFSPDGSACATGGADGYVRLWAPADGWARRLAVRPGRPGIVGLAFTPDGSALAFGWRREMGQKVGLLDAATGRTLALADPEGLSHWLQGVAVSPDGRTAVAVESGLLWQYSVPRLRGRPRLPWFSPTPSGAAAFAPDGTLATGSSGGVLLWRPGFRRRYEPVTLQPVRVPGVPESGVAPPTFVGAGAEFALAFSPDGSLLAGVTGSENFRAVHVWRLADESLVAEHRGRSVWEAVTFLADGRRLVTASREGRTRLWDALTLKPLATHDWGVGPLWCVAAAPDELTCAAGSHAGKLVVWDV